MARHRPVNSRETPTKGAIFYEVRSVGQKSNGQLENLFRIPTMAVLKAAADGSLATYDISGYADLPFASQRPCGVCLPRFSSR